MPRARPRLISLDVFRGLTVAAMILVTDPGTYSAVYPQLLHADWAGWTLTDMIFPSFLVISGVAIPLAYANRLERGDSARSLMVHTARRAALLILVGLVLNGFPTFDLATLRIPGVLQRIGLCYFFGATLYLAVWARGTRTAVVTLGATAAGLLLLYWGLLELVPVPGFGPGRLDSNGNLGAWIDRSLFTVPHLWPYGLTAGVGVTFDPEGLLSTLPAIATLLIGVIAGEWMRSTVAPLRKTLLLAGAGLALLLTGLALSPVVPIIKKIWTPSFALLSGGFALCAFALAYFVIDLKGWRRGLLPALIFGTNAIAAFALSGIITSLLTVVHMPTGDSAAPNLHAWLNAHLFASWLPPQPASLAYALAIVLLNLLLLYPFYRRKIFLRL